MSHDIVHDSKTSYSASTGCMLLSRFHEDSNDVQAKGISSGMNRQTCFIGTTSPTITTRRHVCAKVSYHPQTERGDIPLVELRLSIFDFDLPSNDLPHHLRPSLDMDTVHGACCRTIRSTLMLYSCSAMLLSIICCTKHGWVLR